MTSTISSRVSIDERIPLKEKPTSKDLINYMIPKEILLRIFSFLDIVSLCRCAQVSKYWNKLALDGSNWQSVSLFDFRVAVEGKVVENLSIRCGDYLKMLTLRGCRSVSDKSMQIFSRNCRNLETINLDDCKQLTDETCKSLAGNCPKMKYLNIASCDVTDTSLKAIGDGCKNLKHIDISNCNKIRPQSIEYLAKNCQGLLSFISVACSGATINDESIKLLSNNCRKLRIVNLNGCSALTNEGVHSLASNCPQLIYCNLSKCFAITDQSLVSLSEGATQLKTLQLIGCHQLTDQGFKALCSRCKLIENLDLEDCVQITDQTIYYLTKYCLNLKRLACSHCDNLTDDGIKHIKKISDSIQYLELDNCPLLTDQSINHLTHCKQLRRLDIYDNNLITRQATKKLYTLLPQLVIHTYFQSSTPLEQQVTEARPRFCRCCSIL